MTTKSKSKRKRHHRSSEIEAPAPAQQLDLKYRPRRISDFVGQSQIKAARNLSQLIAIRRPPRQILLSGTTGVGKTSLAYFGAAALNCEQSGDAPPCGNCEGCKKSFAGAPSHVMHYHAVHYSQANFARNIGDQVIYGPWWGVKFTMYLLDEAHSIPRKSFDMLLPYIEEPVKGIVFCICTTDLDKIPDAILSRCHCFDLETPLPAEIEARLRYIAEQEGATLKPETLKAIAKKSKGIVRTAIKRLEQEIAMAEYAKKFDGGK